MKGARNAWRAVSSRAIEGIGESESASIPPSYGGYASGADQAGVRLYNERLLLSLVRRFGALSKIEVARLTGLSVQSTSAIMNRLQTDGLLKREAPLRGRVGQPTIPMSLDPEGVFSLGLKIGRRSCDLVLIDFCGSVRRRTHHTYAYPTPAMILDFVRSSLPPLVDALTDPERRRIAGLGVTAISSISSSAHSSAADWCSTERCAPDAPETLARSDPCRSWPRAKAAPRRSSSPAHRSTSSNDASSARGPMRRRCGRRPARGRNSGPISTPGSRTWRRLWPMPRSRRSRLSISRRSSSTALCLRTCAIG